MCAKTLSYAAHDKTRISPPYVGLLIHMCDMNLLYPRLFCMCDKTLSYAAHDTARIFPPYLWGMTHFWDGPHLYIDTLSHVCFITLSCTRLCHMCHRTLLYDAHGMVCGT